MNNRDEINNLREQITNALGRLNDLEESLERKERESEKDSSEVGRKHIGCIVDFADENNFSDANHTRSTLMCSDEDDEEFPYEAHLGESFRYAKLPEKLTVALKDHLPKHSPHAPDCVEDGDLVLYKTFGIKALDLKPASDLDCENAWDVSWEDVEKYVVIKAVM